MTKENKNKEESIWDKQFTFDIVKVHLNDKFQGYQIAVKNNIFGMTELYQTVYDNIDDIVNAMLLTTTVKIGEFHKAWDEMKRLEKEDDEKTDDVAEQDT